MSHRHLRVIALGVIGVACASKERPIISPVQMAELWELPTDLERRDLLRGPVGSGGPLNPDEEFEFKDIKESGTQPGYDVKDSKGREWSVKLGQEARTEVVMSRLVWALGYHQPSVYYLPRWTLVRDGKKTVHPKSRFRLEDAKKVSEWSWRMNPFFDTQPLAGLYVLMVMVNNWDLKSQQNAVYEVKESEPGPRIRYVVKDLGASLGRSAWPVQGTKDDPEGFEEEPFIEEVVGNRVRFGYQGAWLEPQLVNSATPHDVRWISGLLSRLTPKQWSDAFRAGGFSEAEADRYIRRLREKIDEGLRVGAF